MDSPKVLSRTEDEPEVEPIDPGFPNGGRQLPESTEATVPTVEEELPPPPISPNSSEVPDDDDHVSPDVLEIIPYETLGSIDGSSSTALSQIIGLSLL